MIPRKDGNTMKKSDILDSIGGISESIIEDVLNYAPEKKNTKRVSVKRLLTVAAAAALFVALTVTCVANAAEISAALSALFMREQEYIEPYAQVINETDTGDKTSMTVRNIAKDGDNYILNITLSNPDGFQAGYLVYDSICLDYKAEGEPRKYNMQLPTGTRKLDNENLILAGATLYEIEEPAQDISLQLIVPAEMSTKRQSEIAVWESGKYHFEIKGLSLIPIITSEDGNITIAEDRTDYADKLEIDFDFNADNVEELPATVLYPNSDFELSGTHFRITKLEHTATSLKITIEDMDKEILEYGDLHFWGTAKLDGFMCPVEYPWRPWFDENGNKRGMTPGFGDDEEGLSNEELKECMDIVYGVINEYKLNEIHYVPEIVFTPEAANVCKIKDGVPLDLWPLNPDGTFNMNVYEYTFVFESATSLDDIQGIDFLAYKYDLSKDYDDEGFCTITRVNGWKNTAE